MKTRYASRWLIVLALLFGAQAVAQTGASASGDKKAAAEEAPQPKYKVGDTLPDFTLRDQNGKEVQLSSFRGKKNVAVAFYVFAFTGG